MRIIYILPLFFLFSCSDSSKEIKVKPNIIYILADDLGYGELGVYGQAKIETPNIDKLAKSGMLFTQHYTSAPVCAPARCMLLTGKHSGHAYVRGNDEWGERSENPRDVWDYVKMEADENLEGQRPLPRNTYTFAQMLQEDGYHTGMIGKWGLGAPLTVSIPNNLGFDFFFGYNCQRQAHTLYPLHLYKNKERYKLKNDTVAPNTKLEIGANPNESESYAAFNLKEYAPAVMFEQLQNFVNVQTNKNPFFLYWATPLPHLPLQAPHKWVEHYRNKFGAETPYLGAKSYFPNQYPRASYAAMISYLDENVGKLVQQLKEKGMFENTIIVFSSDNGPTFLGGADTEWFDSAAPFSTAYGRGKGFVYEGGIRVPMIVSWPDKIKKASKNQHASVQYDVFATVKEIIGNTENIETDGISFLPTLLNMPLEQKQHEFLYWEFPEYKGQIAIRMGNWKLVRQQLKTPNPSLELYDLASDSLEINNIANQHPEILKQMDSIYQSQHKESSVERFQIPAIKNGLLVDLKKEY